MNESPTSTAMEPSAFLEPLAVYLEAFAEHDAARRGELLTRCLTADAEIWGPKRVFAGYAAISEKIAGFHKNWPECRLVLASGVNTFGNVARFAKAIVNEEGSVVASGQSVLELAPDGRISRVIPFWEALPPIPLLWPQHLAVPSSRETPNAA
ncbi:nuclear transport factor 2 family protein [Piscinibacter sp. XHJ-5]|uniref:nuclear transport factor 2 family protein n=1 Tax=Piscinibacter sp. XHJ-5 TaxID=3037797 RepID=UPI0024534A49|nr:nuclear transport factor 2 family protein [Piscinibacter sp. XHJ-5]